MSTLLLTWALSCKTISLPSTAVNTIETSLTPSVSILAPWASRRYDDWLADGTPAETIPIGMTVASDPESRMISQQDLTALTSNAKLSNASLLQQFNLKQDESSKRRIIFQAPRGDRTRSYMLKPLLNDTIWLKWSQSSNLHNVHKLYSQQHVDEGYEINSMLLVEECIHSSEQCNESWKHSSPTVCKQCCKSPQSIDPPDASELVSGSSKSKWSWPSSHLKTSTTSETAFTLNREKSLQTDKSKKYWGHEDDEVECSCNDTRLTLPPPELLLVFAAPVAFVVELDAAWSPHESSASSTNRTRHSFAMWPNFPLKQAPLLFPDFPFPFGEDFPDFPSAFWFCEFWFQDPLPWFQPPLFQEPLKPLPPLLSLLPFPFQPFSSPFPLSCFPLYFPCPFPFQIRSTSMGAEPSLATTELLPSAIVLDHLIVAWSYCRIDSRSASYVVESWIVMFK